MESSGSGGLRHHTLSTSHLKTHHVHIHPRTPREDGCTGPAGSGGVARPVYTIPSGGPSLTGCLGSTVPDRPHPATCKEREKQGELAGGVMANRRAAHLRILMSGFHGRIGWADGATSYFGFCVTDDGWVFSRRLAGGGLGDGWDRVRITEGGRMGFGSS